MPFLVTGPVPGSETVSFLASSISWTWYSPVAAGISAVVRRGGRWVSCRARSRASTTLLTTAAKTRSPAATNSSCGMPTAGMSHAASAAPMSGAERTTRSHDGEQPLALLLGVEIVGKGPELRHDHQIEDANPEEEHHCHGNAGLGESVEGNEADDEECGHRVQQPAPGQPVGQRPYAGTRPRSRRAWPAAAYDLTSAPSPARISASRTGLMK